MDSNYRTESTSLNSAMVSDIVLSENEGGSTRRILRAEIVDNPTATDACVKITIMHQKRHNNDFWRDADSFDLRTLSGGQEVRIKLDTAQTFRLFQVLPHIYEIGRNGISLGAQDFMVLECNDGFMVTEEVRNIIQTMLTEDSESFSRLLDDIQPDILRNLALAKLHESRANAVRMFREQMSIREWSEAEWEDFFRDNIWIFGLGLNYQFLQEIQAQPYYGGTTLAGNGGQRGDTLLATGGQSRFTVILDIKKPNTGLVKEEQYRNKVYKLNDDLTGGISQLQSYCRSWITDGSRQEENRERLEDNDIYTYEPKGILVIGDTGTLDNSNKRATFELFRRNLHNPEIITYDELLARAEFIVSVVQ